jgi:hypothetical protein
MPHVQLTIPLTVVKSWPPSPFALVSVRSCASPMRSALCQPRRTPKATDPIPGCHSRRSRLVLHAADTEIDEELPRLFVIEVPPGPTR